MNYWIPLLIASIDQMSKRLATFYFHKGITKSFLCFQNEYIWNKGISFGLFSDSYYFILIYFFIIISAFAVIYQWAKTKNFKDSIALGLIVGGGFSNLFDRIFFGAVLDFISIKFYYNLPIFNFADIAITVGALILSRKLFSIK